MLIEDSTNQPFLSMASLWEMAIKLSLGKLNLGQSFETLIPQQMDQNGIKLTNIEINHLVIVSALPFYHRDPFDRLLIAQAIAKNLPIISADSSFDAYPIQRLW